MEKSGVISEYVERLVSELRYDQSLAKSVRREVEDHLWEAVAAADPLGAAPEAERCAVAHFGDPRAIAAQFAVVSVTKRARKAGVLSAFAIAAVFIAMKARLALYALTQWPAVNQMVALNGVVASIDRYAFWLSVLVGATGWIYIGSRRIPGAFNREYRAQLRRFFLLCSATAGALIVSVISDGVLASLRLFGTRWSFGSLIPIFSMAIEIVCTGLLVLSIRAMARRTPSTACLAN